LITVFCIQKGGSSKTTTTVCTGHTLSTVYGKKVLVIDLDGQSNTTCSFGFLEPESIDNTILDVLRNEKDINDCIYETNYGVDLIPSNKYLSSFVVDALTNQDKYGNPVYILKEKLQGISKAYDHILIDLPPELGVFTISALIAADNVVIPAQHASLISVKMV
jgi:chromosome partitioning protein